MTELQALVIAIVVSITLLIVMTIRHARRISRKPCYRCGGNAKVEYMSLPYCEICQTVVIRMLPMVGLGGMPGFPGASGHTEFVPLSKKKEDQDG